jgi:hypothetical protein
LSNRPVKLGGRRLSILPDVELHGRFDRVVADRNVFQAAQEPRAGT